MDDMKKLASELGRRGGMKVLKKHGRKYFSRISKKRWAKRKKQK